MKNLNILTHGLIATLVLIWSVSAQGGGTFKINETKWLSVGTGLRTSFFAVEDTAGRTAAETAAGRNNDKWSTDFNLENIRLYINAQLHEYIKLEFNTECTDCFGGKGDLIILDVIGKFEFSDYANIWVGRQLVPSDRAELDGPFYQNTFEFNKTPFYPSDHGNFNAGRFGRDDGVNIWGTLTADKRLAYVVGAFDGLDDGANADDNFLYAARISYNFLEVEKNPGYYTSSTYYGKGGDIFTVAVAAQYQEDGAGIAADPADFFGTSVDVLFEKVLSDNSVITLEGEYKYFDLNGIMRPTLAASATNGCFCLFEGNAYTGTALYLFPQKIGIGQFQPYVRYTLNEPDNSADRDEYEAGVNYVIDGHNARISLMYQYGDLETKGRFNFSPTAAGDYVSAIKLGLQLQI